MSEKLYNNCLDIVDNKVLIYNDRVFIKCFVYRTMHNYWEILNEFMNQTIL